MAITTRQVLAELPNTARRIAKTLDAHTTEVQEVLRQLRKDGVACILPMSQRRWGFTVEGQHKYDTGRLRYPANKSSNNGKPKRKYTRRQNKKVGILLQIEMLETRVGNIEKLLGIEI